MVVKNLHYLLYKLERCQYCPILNIAKRCLVALLSVQTPASIMVSASSLNTVLPAWKYSNKDMLGSWIHRKKPLGMCLQSFVISEAYKRGYAFCVKGLALRSIVGKPQEGYDVSDSLSFVQGFSSLASCSSSIESIKSQKFRDILVAFCCSLPVLLCLSHWSQPWCQHVEIHCTMHVWPVSSLYRAINNQLQLAFVREGQALEK